MRNPRGYALWTGPDSVKERDTFTCFHCNRIVIVEPKADPATCGGFCRLCMNHICLECTGKTCEPFEKKLEQWESRDRMLKAITGP